MSEMPDYIARMLLEDNAGCALLIAKQLLGDKMTWMDSACPQTKTCWSLDGGKTFASDEEIRAAAGLPSAVGAANRTSAMKDAWKTRRAKKNAMKTAIIAAIVLLAAPSAFAGSLLGDTTNNTPIATAGAASSANAGAIAVSSLTSDPSASSGGNQFKSNSGSTTAIAVAPPSFGGNLSNAVGPEGYVLSYSVGLPIIGGGWAESEVAPNTLGLINLVEFAYKMKVEADQSHADIMKAALCTYYKAFAEAAKTVCE